MDKARFRASCIVYGDTNETLAKALGIGANTLSAKINGHTAFTFPEVEAIAERYSLTPDDAWRIFGKNFKPKVTENVT